MPQWASHWVDVLGHRLGDLMNTTLTSSTTLNVWSDCGGMGTEMFALADLTASIQARYGVLMKANLHCVCDNEKHCRDMAIDNHTPTHVSDDIYNRNFDDGTFECSLCADTHAMPTHGLDVYVCCFPCGPWSKCGKKLGFNDAAGELCWQAIASIKYMQPSLYMMENVVAIGDGNDLGTSDLQVIKAHMGEHLPGYTHLVITGIDPTFNGFPVRKLRTLLIGGRSEVIAFWNFYGIPYIASPTRSRGGFPYSELSSLPLWSPI
jgi:site-specific DNA-cytosine methylase